VIEKIGEWKRKLLRYSPPMLGAGLGVVKERAGSIKEPKY